jgi:hypothetical protein
MVRKRAWIVLVVVAIGLIAWMHRAPNVGEWPRFHYYRCLDCDGPVSINPDCPEQWGCRACEFATYRITRQFRFAVRKDFDDVRDYRRAVVDAGGLDAYVGTHPTPVAIWSKAGGSFDHRKATPANADKPVVSR